MNMFDTVVCMAVNYVPYNNCRYVYILSQTSSHTHSNIHTYIHTYTTGKDTKNNGFLIAYHIY